MAVVLTLLYATGSRPDRMRRAYASDADAIVLDLEDPVSPATKDVARRDVAALIAEQPDRLVQVRVNGLSTPWAERDLEMVATLPPTVGVRLPKVADRSEVERVLDAVGPRPVHCLIETAVGVERAVELAAAPYVASVALGEADLRTDLGIEEDAGLDWCRQRIVVAARAAGLPPPMMGAYRNVTDPDGLAATCQRGARMGYLGRAAVDPRQLPVIVAAFEPSAAEVSRAREIVEALEKAIADGVGTALLSDGQFVDVSHLDRYRRTLELAQRYAGSAD